MARSEAAAEAAHASEAAHALVRQLVAEKLKVLVPMTAVFMVSYIGLTALAGFAKSFAGMKVVGSLNLGFLLIAANYLLSWALALIYGRVAATRFDPLAQKAAAAAIRNPIIPIATLSSATATALYMRALSDAWRPRPRSSRREFPTTSAIASPIPSKSPKLRAP